MAELSISPQKNLQPTLVRTNLTYLLILCFVVLVDHFIVLYFLLFFLLLQIDKNIKIEIILDWVEPFNLDRL